MAVTKRRRKKNSIDSVSSNKSVPSNVINSFEPRPMLCVGSEGEKVKNLQNFLSNEGLYEGIIDGIFGSLTEKAVKLFQRQHKLVVNGIVGSTIEEFMNNVQSAS